MESARKAPSSGAYLGFRAFRACRAVRAFRVFRLLGFLGLLGFFGSVSKTRTPNKVVHRKAPLNKLHSELWPSYGSSRQTRVQKIRLGPRVR